MLKLSGYIKILNAIGHVIGFFWAFKMFTITGIGKQMHQLAQPNASIHYLLAIFVAIIFFIFGL